MIEIESEDYHVIKFEVAKPKDEDNLYIKIYDNSSDCPDVPGWFEAAYASPLIQELWKAVPDSEKQQLIKKLQEIK